MVVTLLALFIGAVASIAPRPAEAERNDPCAVRSRSEERWIDGRRYLVWPSSVTQQAPILLLLHGWSSSPEKIAASSGLPDAAAASGWTVVAPQGSGSPSRWALPGRLEGADDVAFVERLVADVARRTCADGRRVVAVGFSNGAAFAGLLACRLPLEGAALVSGANLATACPQAAGLPMVLTHGAADPIVRVEGGPVLGGRLHAIPFADAAAQWQARGATVTTSTVPNWGHRWPPGTTEAVLATFEA